MSPPSRLPIEPYLPAIADELTRRGSLVVDASPGAGKTTRVPVALLESGLASKGQIVVLEPRRLAARFAAERVAASLGEPVGKTVGYRVRFDQKASAQTKVLFVTEGVFTRQLMSNPTLDDTSVVIIDEFHERHLQGDLALAWCERLRQNERPDLKLLVMSATLDGDGIAAHLQTTCIRCEGRMHPVEIEHLPRGSKEPLGTQVAMAVRDACKRGLEGHVLVFLPGMASIRQAERACAPVARDHDLLVLPLHGRLPASEQDRALTPSHQTKVILSTNVAETSLTIDGIATVIDSGLCKRARHNDQSGLRSVRPEPISQASATQRAGRAGRTQSGRCLRLYTRHDLDRRPAFDPPQITRDDLSELYLCAAQLPTAARAQLSWFTPPEPRAWSAAHQLLRSLGALDERDELSEAGAFMSQIPAHPRLARVLLEAEKRGIFDAGCRAAAALSEGRPLIRQAQGTDFLSELERLDELLDVGRSVLRAPDVEPTALTQAARIHKQLLRLRPKGSSVGGAQQGEEEPLTACLLAGFVDRVGCRQGKPPASGPTPVTLTSGKAMSVRSPNMLGPEGWCIALDAEERQQGRGVIRRAVPLRRDTVLEGALDHIEEHEHLFIDEVRGRAMAKSELRLGSLVVETSTFAAKPSAACTTKLADWLIAQLECREDERDAWLARLRFAHGCDDAFIDPTPDNIRAALVEALQDQTVATALGPRPIVNALSLALGSAAGKLDHLAPSHLTLSNGRPLKVDYPLGGGARLRSYMQDFFGVTETPRVGAKTPVLELWAPNGRAEQVTQDLESFWREHYPGLKRTLSRRYPKHHWPDDPISAPPVRLKRKLQQR